MVNKPKREKKTFVFVFFVFLEYLRYVILYAKRKGLTHLYTTIHKGR